MSICERLSHPDFPNVEIWIEGEDDDAEAVITVRGVAQDQLDVLLLSLERMGIDPAAVRIEV